MAYTRAQVRSLVQQRCDIENATHQQNSEFNNHLNDAARYVHDFLISTYGNRYALKTEQFLTTAGVSDYHLETVTGVVTGNLINDCYRVASVKLRVDDIDYPLGSYEDMDGPRYNSSQSWGPGYLPEYLVHYDLDSTSDIIFSPKPDAAYTILLQYHPVAPEYTSDSAVVSLPHTDLLIIEACIRAKDKEERDASRFMQERALIEKRIEDRASPVDHANPPQTIRAAGGGRAIWRRERVF